MSVVVLTLIPALGRLGQEDHEFKASIDYIAKPYPKKKKNTSFNSRNFSL
jgi:hypothetical protein